MLMGGGGLTRIGPLQGGAWEEGVPAPLRGVYVHQCGGQTLRAGGVAVVVEVQQRGAGPVRGGGLRGMVSRKLDGVLGVVGGDACDNGDALLYAPDYGVKVASERGQESGGVLGAACVHGGGRGAPLVGQAEQVCALLVAASAMVGCQLLMPIAGLV
eukprot:7298448-Pyramimonas_sp.AAC.2